MAVTKIPKPPSFKPLPGYTDGPVPPRTPAQNAKLKAAAAAQPKKISANDKAKILKSAQTWASPETRLTMLGGTPTKTGSGTGLKGGGSTSGYSNSSGGSSGYSSGGGGGGGSSSSGGGGSTGPTSPGTATPNANGYLPIAADLFTTAPEGMLAELVQEWYPGESGNGLYQMLRPYADVANILFLAERGTSAEGGTKDEYVNWLKSYFDSLKSTGFNVSVDDLLSNVFNAAEGSPLFAFQATGSPIQQQQNTQQLYGAIMDTYMHPLISNAYRNQMDIEGARYIGESGKAVQQPFFQYVQGLPSKPMLKVVN